MTNAENGVSGAPAANEHSVEDKDRANEERIKANEQFKRESFGRAGCHLAVCIP